MRAGGDGAFDDRSHSSDIADEEIGIVMGKVHLEAVVRVRCADDRRIPDRPPRSLVPHEQPVSDRDDLDRPEVTPLRCRSPFGNLPGATVAAHGSKTTQGEQHRSTEEKRPTLVADLGRLESRSNPSTSPGPVRSAAPSCWLAPARLLKSGTADLVADGVWAVKQLEQRTPAERHSLFEASVVTDLAQAPGHLQYGRAAEWRSAPPVTSRHPGEPRPPNGAGDGQLLRGPRPPATCRTWPERRAIDERLQTFELLEVIDRFATGFDEVPELVEGRADYRSLISTGLLVRAFAVVGQLASDGAVERISLDIDPSV